MLSALSSFSAWDWLDIFGLSFVLAGVAGGFRVRRKKYRISSDLNDLMPSEFRKTAWELRRKQWEDAWEYLLIIGLGLELIALPKHFLEAGRLHKQAEQLESANLGLRAKVVELENNMADASKVIAKMKPRRLTTEKQRRLADFFRSKKELNGATVLIVRVSGDEESREFAQDIFWACDRAGIGVPVKRTIGGTITLGVSESSSLPSGDEWGHGLHVALPRNGVIWGESFKIARSLCDGFESVGFPAIDVCCAENTNFVEIQVLKKESLTMLEWYDWRHEMETNEWRMATDRAIHDFVDKLYVTNHP